MKNSNTVSVAFETGKTYIMSWIGDSDLKTVYKVLSRTDKTIKIQNRGEVITCRVSIWDGVEQVSPTGKYSMSPTLSADKPEVKASKPVQKSPEELRSMMHVLR
ncbi:MAG: hypothetical protein ACI9JN_001258 [Bacteroidia bacterium]|jgi:hypothetical protein